MKGYVIAKPWVGSYFDTHIGDFGSVYRASFFTTEEEAMVHKRESRNYKVKQGKVMQVEVDFDAVHEARQTIVKFGLGHIADPNEKVMEIATTMMGTGCFLDAIEAFSVIYRGGIRRTS